MIQTLPSARSCSALPTYRILIVDDNVDTAMLLGMLLREEGHSVQLAHDGPSALQMAGAFLPDVVLLDIGLPQMDGNEVARRLREQPALRNTLLVAVSGYGQAESQQRALQSGFNAYLVKPITLEALNGVFAQLADRS